ncbi:hypothetical protein [Bernardetia sp.]|uniref:hypothetical protein n=1 Tax=Bernardetia sp. TaxID=1937974 RepID=UPI0025BFD192|nr:hypothetical protein [Bernardetia sp.]
MNQFLNNSNTSQTATSNLALNTNRNNMLKTLSLGFIFSVFLVFFFSICFSSQAQNADKNKHLAVFQDKTYIGLATEDNKEIIYTKCGEPVSTFYFDVSNGEPMFVMAGLYDITMYQVVGVKKDKNKYLLTYRDAKNQKQVAQLDVETDNNKIYLIFEGMKMGFAVREKMTAYKISNDCDEMRMTSPNKK